ncbi:hypothetical protein DFH09DRAFT_1106115 [Mycena vulgaris]|nr:hypothetical protein DFH09DRAFT_1106115 [Mycena vulgaris]
MYGTQSYYGNPGPPHPAEQSGAGSDDRQDSESICIEMINYTERAIEKSTSNKGTDQAGIRHREEPMEAENSREQATCLRAGPGSVLNSFVHEGFLNDNGPQPPPRQHPASADAGIRDDGRSEIQFRIQNRGGEQLFSALWASFWASYAVEMVVLVIMGLWDEPTSK